MISSFQQYVAQAEQAREQVEVQQVMQKVQRKGVQRGATKGSIAATIIAGLAKGHKPAKVLANVHKKHAGCNTTIACVYWYASRIKRGLIIAQ